MLLISIIIVITIYYCENKKYKKETYYKITKVSFLEVRSDAGKFGEYLTYKRLKDFEIQGAKFLFNIYIPKENKETTEIDVLMISKKGIFAFESKNYNGWIFGSDHQKYWCQVMPAGPGRSHKEKFYNPIFQNNTHIKYLKSFLGDIAPIHSIIIFSDRCALKKVDIQNTSVKVINRYQVYSLISSIYNNSEDYLTNEQIDEIYNKLYPYTQVDESIKQKHINNIKNNIKRINNNMTISIEKENTTDNIENIIKQDISNNKNTMIEEKNNTSTSSNEFKTNIAETTVSNKEKELICPICGSKLLLKTNTYNGQVIETFYECSNYPKCKYIKD